MTLFDSDYAAGEHRRWTRGQRWGASLIGLATAVGLTFALLPSPYVIEQPGPVYDTIGSVQVDGKDVDLISISGTQSFPTTGTLDMLTVSIVGEPEHPLSWVEAGLAWFDPHRALIPMDAIWPPGQSSDQQKEQNQAQMVNSQQDAIAAALLNLNLPVERRVTIVDVPSGTPADGILQAGDTVRSANGVSVATVAELKDQVNALAGKPVPLSIERAGAILELSVTPERASNGTYLMGVGAKVAYTFPFEVKIQLDNVGGPSAGMMFALGIMAKLTPGDALTGGKHWAGTGTIDADGLVGDIGGIRQKMVGARAAGADYMLAPKGNCDEVVGHIPAGLEVFAVSTLAEAKRVVETVAADADTSQLPRCPAG